MVKVVTNAISILIILCYLMLIPAIASSQLTKVIVIAPSVSTSMEARQILRDIGWVETTNWREANGILVVVRSMLYNPLNYSYDSPKELEDHANMQLNIAGENFHIYVYSIENDLSVRQLKHIKYKAD